MKIIKPSYEIIDKQNLTPFALIETVGRTCYKSEDKITSNSAVPFIQGLINRNHWAMLEHSNVIILCSKEFCEVIKNIFNTKYLHISIRNILCVVSGSFRAWKDAFEDYMEKFFKNKWNQTDSGIVAIKLIYTFYLECPTIFSQTFNDYVVPFYSRELPYGYDLRGDYIEFLDESSLKQFYERYPKLLSKHLTHTVKFICDRGVSHEIVRHRPCGFAQESTRYCNYSKGKFGNEITVIEPFFFRDIQEESPQFYLAWKQSCEEAEFAYNKLIEYGATPQEARSVLPNSLKTEIFVTATEKEWQHIFNLRAKGTTGKPHPQIEEIMKPCFEEMKVLTEGRIC